MNAHRNPLRRIAALAAFAFLALAMTGCAKKPTNPDASYILDSTYVSNPSHGGVEGQYSQSARLIVYPDVTMSRDSMVDKDPVGRQGPEDSLASTTAYPMSPGTVHGLIVDQTAASAYQVLRRESNGGFASLKDYFLNPAVRLLESQSEVYAFDDPRPASFDPPTYVGRGVVSGQISRTSPLTNLGKLASREMPDLAILTPPPAPTLPRAWPDSNITMRWAEVSGAAGYWIQIYTYASGANEDARFLLSQPAPLVTRLVLNRFVAFVPAGTTEYQLGQEVPPGMIVFMRRMLLMNREYYVRVSAVDAAGRMIAFSYGDYWIDKKEGVHYNRYRMGAARVQPKIPE
jgi:hypothetical protein